MKPSRFTYEFARPGLAVDCVVFGFDDEDLKVLLIQRKLAPFRGRWALPGGFVREGESLDDAAGRELAEETGLGRVFLEQLYSFGDPGRDPRGHVVSVAYYALVRLSSRKVRAVTDARDKAWFSCWDPPRLAFDHDSIVKVALARLKAKVRYQPIGFELVPPRFTLSQLQRVYETILERPLDKRNFRKKLLAMGLLVELDEVERGVAHRAARLYGFGRKQYQALEKRGFHFEL